MTVSDTASCVALSFCCLACLSKMHLSHHILQVMCWSGAPIMHRKGGLLYLWWLLKKPFKKKGEGPHIWALVGAPVSFGFPEL